MNYLNKNLFINGYFQKIVSSINSGFTLASSRRRKVGQIIGIAKFKIKKVLKNFSNLHHKKNINYKK